MTFNDAIKLFDGNVRKMADTLGLSTQSVYYYKKNGDSPLPPVRVFQIKTILKIDDWSLVKEDYVLH